MPDIKVEITLAAGVTRAGERRAHRSFDSRNPARTAADADPGASIEDLRPIPLHDPPHIPRNRLCVITASWTVTAFSASELRPDTV